MRSSRELCFTTSLKLKQIQLSSLLFSGWMEVCFSPLIICLVSVEMQECGEDMGLCHLFHFLGSKDTTSFTHLSLVKSFLVWLSSVFGDEMIFSVTKHKLIARHFWRDMFGWWIFVVWFAGPGCSSLGVGAFSENGPFRPSGELLVRNEYSWNRGKGLTHWSFFLHSNSG